ncbi:MAG: YbbR-like domain-containing protein, partial [Lachnospiraceae bacterium]|nr:YbbR-like domain-containing protein [Lachnospiraceae bacterium]
TEGAVIPTDRLSQSIRNSSIKIPILETKTVPIRYSVLGVPSAGYRLNGVDQITKTDVLIAGSRRIVRGINEVNISNAIDISGSTDTFVKDIDLWDYLINGIRLVEPDDNIVKVTIGIEEESSRVVTLRENQLRVLNMPEGFKSSFTEFVESGPVILVGLQENLDQIRSSNIVGEIDIAKWMADSNISFLTEGFYNIPININLGPNITVANSITVLVNITFVEDD